MKKHPVSLLRRAAALALALALAVPPVAAAAGEEKLQTTAQLVEGLTYRNTVTVNSSSRVESFSLELEEDSDAYPILLQASGTIYGAATINKAVSYAQSLGYHVLGAVNTDFFSTSSGVPIGIVIEDGIYKSSPGNEAAMVIIDGQVSLVESPKVTLTLTNQRDDTQVTPHHFNKWRSSTGGLYLLNQDFSSVSTRTSTSGWYVRMKLVDDGAFPSQDVPRTAETASSLLTVNSTLELEVTELIQSDQPLTIGEGEYILTADDVSGYSYIYQTFQVGDQITLTASCTDETLSAAQWAGGVGDVIVRDGAVTDSSNWTYAKDGRAPRTALGVREDGTLVVYAVDGRQSGYSMGLSELDLAQEMLARGCVWAVNLDGGGSTAISVWVPGQSGPSVRNLPSDGQPRSCATYLLLVTDQKGDGRPDRLALTQDGLVVLAGTSVQLPSAVVLDDGLNLLDRQVSDLTVASQNDLGQVEDGVFTAGTRAGTETLTLKSRSLGVEGTAQIHVVDALTSLTISRQDSSSPLTSLQAEPGEQIQLAVTGSYWGREALRDWSAVTWTVEGQVGTVDENGLLTISQEGGEGSVTASAGGLTQTIAVSMTNVFRDVTEDHWAYEAVKYCYDQGIVSGVSATEYGKDYQIRRGDFMLMLYGAVGKPAVTSPCTFTDVSQSDYYYTALAWAQSVGLASGTGEGAFSPNEPITREQAFTILRQVLPLLGKQCPVGSLTVLDQFADKDLIADYAKGHIATLVSQGLVSGKGANVDPRGSLTRAEMAALLYKIMTYTPVTDPGGTGETTDPGQTTDPGGTGETTQPEDPSDSQEELPDPSLYTLTLDQTQLTLGSGESVSLTAALSPQWEGAQIQWTSSDSSAAAVTSAGVVTNLYPGTGTATVTITASWNGLSASCTVSCQPADLTGTVIDAENGLNVRSGPGTEYAVVGGLANGSQVVVLKAEGGWCNILYLNRSGQAAIGYVSGTYIRLNTASQTGAAA